MKQKKIILIAITVLIYIMTPLSAFAASTTITENNLADGSNEVEVPVEALIHSTFTVSLPSTIVLNSDVNQQYKYESVVGVKGDLISGSEVMVIPNTSITLYDVSYRPETIVATPNSEEDQTTYSHKSPITGSITQGATSWTQEEILKTVKDTGSNYTYDVDTGFHNVSLSITVMDLKSGSWEGIAKFDIKYTE